MRKPLFPLLATLILMLACNLLTAEPIDDSNYSASTPTKLVKAESPKLTDGTLAVQTEHPAVNETPSGSTSCPQNDGLMAFAAEADLAVGGTLNYEIFIANSDGTQLHRLSNDDRWDGNPAWSLERCRIAYSETTDQDSNQDIIISNADGTGLIRLTNDPSFDREPSWSPSGMEIAFMREHENNRDVFVMSIDGSSVRQLTDDPAQDEDPEWSPVNDEIVFSSRRDGNWEIYLANSEGSDLVRLTEDKSQDTHPTWSPDGLQIAFISNRSDYNEVYIMDKDGSNLRQVTFQNGVTPTVDIELNWSQDGNSLAFTCTVPGKDGGGMQAICMVGVDGGNVRTLVNLDPRHAHEPDW